MVRCRPIIVRAYGRVKSNLKSDSPCSAMGGIS
jgi:hypothetical protein